MNFENEIKSIINNLNNRQFTKVIESLEKSEYLSMSIVVSKQKTIFIGDVNIHQKPLSFKAFRYRILIIFQA